MIGLIVALAVAGVSPPTSRDCHAPGTIALEARAATRTITPLDLAHVKDIGAPAYDQDAPAISVSPDGQSVAFQLRQADPAGNSYCLSMWIAPTNGQGSAIMVDSGGELIMETYPFWGGPVYPSGVPMGVKAAWSPDGQHIAFLKKLGGHTQAWVAGAKSSIARMASSVSTDVDTVAWTADGRSLRIGVTQTAELTAQLETEARIGYHLDERFVPVSASRPYLMAPIARSEEVVAAFPGQTHLQESAVQAHQRPHRWRVVGGGQAFSQQSVANIGTIIGQGVRCYKPACGGRILAAWTADAQNHVAFLRREGVAGSTMSLYLWDRRSGRVDRKYRTAGLLLGCVPSDVALVCSHEEATQPRHIVSMDPDTGQMREIYDPNPEFRSFRLGKVQRLFWKNDRGIATFGDFVLPPDHRDGQRHPLIIVTYRSRGFLRGGTGDEYPIFPLAARGYAVLSFDTPPDIASLVKTTSSEDYSAINQKDWANRWSVQSALEAGIATVEALGMTDPKRRGVTGLSDGATTAWFALINSNLFQAAIVSTCCMEPDASMALLGEKGAHHFENGGFPRYTDDDSAYAARGSVARNAARLTTPTLLNLADAEFRYGLVSVKELRAFRQPVDAYIFPDEEHVKWQPAHRLAIYERNIAWFDFWLRDIAPTDAVEAERWNGLRAAAPRGVGK